MPMGIVILLNICIYVLVLKRLTKTAPGRVTSEKKTKKVKSQLKNAAMFLLLLGLTWSIGYFAVIKSISFLAQLFFCLLNSMLGYFLFVMYVVRIPSARKQFTACLKPALFQGLKSERHVSSSGGVSGGITAGQIPNNRNRFIGATTTGVGRRAASFHQRSVPLTSVERNRIDNSDMEDGS